MTVSDLLEVKFWGNIGVVSFEFRFVYEIPNYRYVFEKVINNGQRCTRYKGITVFYSEKVIENWNGVISLKDYDINFERIL